MRLNRVTKMIGKNRSILLVPDAGSGVCWFCFAGAAAPVYGVDAVAEETAAALLSIPAEEAGEYRLDVIPAGRYRGELDFRDVTGDETHLQSLGVGLCDDVGTLEVFADEYDRAWCVDASLLRPFRQEHGELLYFLRVRHGTPQIAVKTGMLLRGILTPAKLGGDWTAQRLRGLADGIDRAEEAAVRFRREAEEGGETE